MTRPKGTVAVRLDISIAGQVARAIDVVIQTDFPAATSLFADAGKTERDLAERRDREAESIEALADLAMALRPKATGRKRGRTSVYFLPRSGILELRRHAVPAVGRSFRMKIAIQRLHAATCRRKGPRLFRGAALDRRIANGGGDERWLRELRARQRMKIGVAKAPSQPSIDMKTVAAFAIKRFGRV